MAKGLCYRCSKGDPVTKPVRPSDTISKAVDRGGNSDNFSLRKLLQIARRLRLFVPF